MAFRGHFVLNGVEIANSSRVAAHLGMDPPTNDLGLLGAAEDCALVPARPNRVVDPGMLDPTKWPTSGSMNATFTLAELDPQGNRAVKLTRVSGATSVIINLATVGSIGLPAAGGEMWRASAWVVAPATNTVPVQARISTRNYDQSGTGLPATGVTAAYVTVNPGQAVRLDATLAVTAGYTHVLNRVEMNLSAPVGAVLWVSQPVVDRLLDPPYALLAEPSASMVPIGPGRLLATPPDGSRLYSPLLALVGDCWSPENMCFSCRGEVVYDDSWDDLQAWLGDTIYRPELAPWYSTQVPESAEFGGIWVMDVKGLDAAPSQRDIVEMAGDGGAPGPGRLSSRLITFDALLVACTNAGLTHGFQWLKNQIRSTVDRDDSVLRFMSAHPGDSAADPTTLVRELHGVVMTREPQITQAVNAGRGEHQQATMYRVTWELTATRPHTYAPPITLPVAWDEIEMVPISWVHAAECKEPDTCAPMPALFAPDCVIDLVPVVATPPPTCGGCMPVCGVSTYTYLVPTFSRPFRTRETAVTMNIVNRGASNLTLQGFWQRCNARSDCDTDQWPIQVTNLPPTGVLTLDGITKGHHVYLGGRKRRPYGMVATPDGRPWRPPVIDRSECWEFVVVADADATFDVTLTLIDREA